MRKNFVGFGFGPIQSALFLLEAYRSGRFGGFTVAEVDADLVSAINRADGSYTVNVAGPDRIEQVRVEGVTLLNPAEADDRAELVAAVGEAEEIATCLPSVRFYDIGGSTSVTGLLAEGLSRRPDGRQAVIYAAENHNHAAEILRESLVAREGSAALEGTQTLNTVIGKMSGVITDPAVIDRLGLATVTPELDRAVLVERFNRILISRIELPGFRRGIEVFVEKPDLLPFEEAKLYGHNAIHALIGYLADLRGLETMADAGADERIMSIAREAFIEESGRALISRHADVDDPLFTPAGYRAYAEDLLERMVCPNLNDLVSRVGRDHRRKLDYDDRLIGTMRIALGEGIEPVNLAMGAAAGTISMIRRADELRPAPAALPADEIDLDRETLGAIFREIWSDKTDEQSGRVLDLISAGLTNLRQQGFLTG